MPVEVISRITSEQEYYDRDPEKAEREQDARREIMEEEKRREEEEAYQAWLDAQKENQSPG